MNITYIVKGNLEILPPLLPRILRTADVGVETRLICTDISDENAQLMQQHGVKVYCTRHCRTLLGKRNKLMDWAGFRSSCKKLLKRELADSDMLYICSADTALALGSFFTKTPYVFQSNELYDMFPRYKNGIKKYAQGAKAFVVPEYSRASICACWYNLPKLPYVIPNIPYVVSRQRNMPISDDTARQLMEPLKDKRIVLYQGHIDKDRTLNSVAMALKEINDDRFCLVLMGKDHNDSVKYLKDIYPQTVHIPFVKAPRHLEITSHANIALLSYDRVSMNNLFCAPNKIYEYSCYGVPMIGNDIPGLRNTVEAYKMGVCAAYEKTESVVEAIKRIDSDYDTYQANANMFFENSDLNRMMDTLLADLGFETR